MRRRLPFHSNAVWPPTWLVALFVIVYGAMDGGIWLLEKFVPNAKEVLSGMPEMVMIRAFILGSAAGCYAVFRLWRFHPACQGGYSGWLKLTPWTPDRPLPLGPLYPVWQDAVVIGTIAAFAEWHAHVSPALCVAVFGLVYLAGFSLLLAVTRTWFSCFLLGVFWPALLLPAMKGWPMFGLLAAIMLVIWNGHRTSMRKFPWDCLMIVNRLNTQTGIANLQIELRIPGLSGTPSLKTTSNVGWPYLALSPKLQCSQISSSTSFFLSLLIGWWTYCATLWLEIPPMAGVIIFFSIMAAAMRLVIYCSSLVPSFSLWGRIVSGRIVVPGFDKVFLTPIAAVILAIAGAIVIRRSGAWFPIAQSGVVVVIWFMLLSGGPTLRKWLLTGQHRYRPAVILGANKQLLRPV